MLPLVRPVQLVLRPSSGLARRWGEGGKLGAPSRRGFGGGRLLVGYERWATTTPRRRLVRGSSRSRSSCGVGCTAAAWGRG